MIQVAWSLQDEQTKKRETAGLLEAMEECELKKGIILTYDEQALIKVRGKIIEVVPVWKWMLEKQVSPDPRPNL